MKKILAVIGSRKGENSYTYKFTKLILDKLIIKDKDIKYEIVSPDKYNIKPCRGCNNCFFKGYCTQDDKDDMNVIKEKMLNANLIILGSPVYAHNVSGDMKIFIDRLSYWLHIFKLSNKKFVTITTSSSNGNIYVNDYLKKVLSFMGAVDILDIEVTTMSPNLFHDDEFMQNEVTSYVDLICNELNSSTYISTELQEKEFRNLKNIISLYDKDNAEYLYWQNSGLKDCESYQEYLLKSKL
ncbi:MULTISPECIES: flavodoxin family protein [Clostridium]|uniref:flavodoxin family protein n=1 Tax=Clostridium TaxID=1485 RepID=UPI000825FCCF|nr:MULTISPECIES: flavodoxin family protein [Clostridium]PJI09180.1 flavodoxin family protein [Clostridium sp. CT7]